MADTEFIYTTYIRTTPEKLWDAITNPESTRQYWEHENISDWKRGSKWQHVASDKKRAVKLVGEVLESMPPKRLVISWGDPADKPSNYSRVAFEIEPIENMICLKVIHDNLKADSEVARKIANGWPRVLSSMKSFLETGKPLNTWAGY